MKIGLRVDVDTHVGLVEGVPRLLDVFGRRGARATFYVTMGPDHSGRAIFGAVFRKGFVRKMLRTRAASTYGLRTVLSGTLLPARPVGEGRPDLLRAVLDAGHELGPHAWDHRRWQDHLDRLAPVAVAADLDRASSALQEVTGAQVTTTAAPAWLSCEASLIREEGMSLAFASDCRGRTPFRPRVAGRDFDLLQVPATLPTLDEALGETCDSAEAFFRLIRGEADRAESENGENAFAVLTVHAGIEGRGAVGDFERFLEEADPAHAFVALGELAAAWREKSARCEMIRARLPGRHGEVSLQGASVAGERK